MQVLASGNSVTLPIAEEGSLIADQPATLLEMVTTYNEQGE
jgi:hypothetical protein